MRVWIAPRETENDGPRPNCSGFAGTFCWKEDRRKSADAEKCFTQALEIAVGNKPSRTSCVLRRPCGALASTRQEGGIRALLVEATGAWPESLQRRLACREANAGLEIEGVRAGPCRAGIVAHMAWNKRWCSAWRRDPENHILLSNSAGNSAAKLAKTNVWRTYQTIDLSKPDQIALYSEKISTSSFRVARVARWRIRLGAEAQRLASLPVPVSQLRRTQPEFRVRLQPRRIHDPHADGPRPETGTRTLAFGRRTPAARQCDLPRVPREAVPADVFSLAVVSRYIAQYLCRPPQQCCRPHTLRFHDESSGAFGRVRRTVGYGGRLWRADQGTQDRHRQVHLAAQFRQHATGPACRARIPRACARR